MRSPDHGPIRPRWLLYRARRAGDAHTPTRRRLTIALLVAVAACGSTTDPVNVLGGSYTLSTYNGGGLPAYIDPALGNCGGMLVAGSVGGGYGGRVFFSRSNSSPCSAGNPITTSSRNGTLSVQGTAVTLTLDADASNASQVYTGTLTSDALTLHYTVDYGPRQLAQTFGFVRQ